MIRFFNKIRKQMIKENKLGRYLKYAIGEIILVMIGILLALQVNNWNQNRQQQKEELKILKSLHQEFSENLIKFDAVYEVHLNRRLAIKHIMSAELQTISTDSLIQLFSAMDNNYTFDPFKGIYNSVINSGKIELVSNDLLKNKLSRIQDLINDYKEEEDSARDFSKQNLGPFLIKQPLIIDYNYYVNRDANEAERTKVKENYKTIIKSYEFNNIMFSLMDWMRAIFEEGPVLRVELVSIINLLEEEIEKHN